MKAFHSIIPATVLCLLPLWGLGQNTDMLDAQYGLMGLQFGDSLDVIQTTYDTLLPQRNFEKKHRYRVPNP